MSAMLTLGVAAYWDLEGNVVFPVDDDLL